MVWAPPGRLPPQLQWTSTEPATHRIKARPNVRGQRRMILSSTPSTPSAHELISWYFLQIGLVCPFLSCFFFLFLGSLECEITQYKRETLDFAISQSVCLFASQTVVVSSARATDRPKLLCGSSEVVLSGLSCYISFALYFTHSSFVVCA